VDVFFDAPLPPGARPNLQVDGNIELEKLSNVLYMGRPGFNLGSPGQKVEVFKLVEDGKAAVRVPVQFGKASVNQVQVLGGLQPGDQVILSDTSQYDGNERLRITG
jgi:HlyD family secretion protein